MQPIPGQTDSVDTAFARLERLLEQVDLSEGTFFTESDSRIKIIDTMLVRSPRMAKGRSHYRRKSRTGLP